MKTWMPGKTYFDIPWWHRDDASTIDIIVSDDVDISIPPSWAFKIIEEEPPKTKKKKGKFKPTIINGARIEISKTRLETAPFVPDMGDIPVHYRNALSDLFLIRYSDERYFLCRIFINENPIVLF